MQINSKPLPQIFKEMSWQSKIIVMAGSAFILFAFFYIPWAYVSLTSDDRPPAAIDLKINGVSPMDVSLTSDGKIGAIAYSYTPVQFLQPGVPQAMQIGLGYTTSECKTFFTIDGGLQAKREELIGPDGMNPVASGVWRLETPSIVYDPDDKGREWKLYAYKYFWANNAKLAHLYSMIVVSTASDPLQKWTTEEWLFSASAQNPPPPYNQLIQQHLNSLSPALADVYFYARPSVIYTNGVTLMTLSAFVRGKNTPDRVVMIASTDHGRTWTYLGAPFTSSDLAKIGNFTKLGGATLLRRGDQVYLSVVPGDDKTDAAGTYVFSFSNVAKAELARDGGGKPVILNNLPRSSAAPTDIGGGYAAYDDYCKSAGMITSEHSGLTRGFALFRTFIRPGDK